MERQKRVAAIHDISCFGRCSLTVALPILSAAGIECAVLPTAALSTHTGGLAGYTYRDLTDDILPIFEHWQSLGLEFDAAYSGFLGSPEQLEIVSGIFGALSARGALIVVDPVMADNGELYATFSRAFPAGMRALCEKADIILPNMTEAALLLGEPYRAAPYTREYAEGLLRRLAALPSRAVVLTGVQLDADKLGAAAIDVRTGKIDYATAEKIPGSYHGTGDIFASAFTACAVAGRPVRDALEIAVDFTVRSIARTKKAGTDVRFGVNFEAGLGEFARNFGA
ncbi:MAG: pyridoxamine kinase [Oscillospiraceae bacterium]|jgi:pyridoxine kinase|nr:pyridoxamine kinase [Oscillospiraceae bacterium]